MAPTYQVTWKQRWHLQEVRNTFYYGTSVGHPSDSEWGDIADEIRADLSAQWRAHCVNDWEFYAIDARRVDLPGYLAREFIPTGGVLQGTSAVDSVPTQVACLARNKGTTTKPNRARVYLAGMDESKVVDSLFTSSLLQAAEALIDLQSNLNTGGTNPLFRVSAQWNTNHTQVLLDNDISGAATVASQVPATQRRRRIGVGI